jgi:hypothetical protein
MDDYQMARLALDAVRTAARLAEQEQRRRQRNHQQELRDTAGQRQSARSSGGDDRNVPRRQPEFEMPASANGEIPDEFLPRL